MTIQLLAQGVGYAVFLICAVAVVLLGLYLVLGLVGLRCWRRITRVYDIYVVEYWIRVARENGRVIPTRADVLRGLEKLDEDARR